MPAVELVERPPFTTMRSIVRDPPTSTWIMLLSVTVPGYAVPAPTNVTGVEVAGAIATVRPALTTSWFSNESEVAATSTQLAVPLLTCSCRSFHVATCTLPATPFAHAARGAATRLMLRLGRPALAARPSSDSWRLWLHCSTQPATHIFCSSIGRSSHVSTQVSIVPPVQPGSGGGEGGAGGGDTGQPAAGGGGAIPRMFSLIVCPLWPRL